MSTKPINLVMWGYQPDFRLDFEGLMNGVLEALGVPESGIDCLLIGAKIPGRSNPNGVCIEPEDDKWPIELLDGLLDLIEAEITDHPAQNTFCGDEPSMGDELESIRRDSVRIAVQKAIKSYDSNHCVRSFAGMPTPVNDHYVVPVFQLPNALFERFRSLREPLKDGLFTYHASFIHAAVFEVLTEAKNELLRLDPGRNLAGRLRSADQIVRRAAASFMYTLRIAIQDNNLWDLDLFERFNMISSLMYEKAKGVGRLLLANPEDGSVDFLLKFAEPVPFRDHRWSRKVLQLVSSKTSLIADSEKIFGLGNVAAGMDCWASQSVFEIEFLDHYSWRLLCGGEVMLASEYGVPSLPQEKFPKNRLLDTYQRLFPESDEEDVDRFAALFTTAAEQRHGSMLVVAKDAASEADRLRGQGIRIEPMKLTPALYRQVSGIDGAIVIDPHGVCHAIGAILDGPARPECTPSRGARYNSGVRYVSSSDTPRLAVVISDDQTVDIIPELPPRIKRSVLEKEISELEGCSPNDDLSAIYSVNRHRFYLNQEQCDRVNKAVERIQRESMEVGVRMRILLPKFSPGPYFNESCFESEDPEPTSL